MALNFDGNEFSNFQHFTTYHGIGHEPKLKNRFVLYIDRLPTIYPYLDSTRTEVDDNRNKSSLLISLKTFARPTYSVESVPVENFNDNVHLIGKPSHSREIACTFDDFIARRRLDLGMNQHVTDSTSEILYRWFSLVYDPVYGAVGYKDKLTVEADLYILTPTGYTTERWHYFNLWPKEVEFGELTHDAAEKCEISVVFQYDRCIMVSSVQETAREQYMPNHKREIELGENPRLPSEDAAEAKGFSENIITDDGDSAQKITSPERPTYTGFSLLESDTSSPESPVVTGNDAEAQAETSPPTPTVTGGGLAESADVSPTNQIINGDDNAQENVSSPETPIASGDILTAENDVSPASPTVAGFNIPAEDSISPPSPITSGNTTSSEAVVSPEVPVVTGDAAGQEATTSPTAQSISGNGLSQESAQSPENPTVSGNKLAPLGEESGG